MAKTYSQLYIEVRNALREAGIEAFSIEARLLLAGAAGKSTAELLRDMSLYTSRTYERKVRQLLGRRLEGEPIAYITGSWEFYGFPFNVDKNVLIPRIDTELLVKEAEQSLNGRKMDARVLDLGCGSGCIGIAIAKLLPKTQIVLLDVSEKAIRKARENAALNRANERVSFITADIKEGPPMMIGSFDLVVSNPPYIPTIEILELDGSVRDYEPLWALDGGEDGLDFYREIFSRWLSVLKPGGEIMVEVGEDQALRVEELMRLAGLYDVDSVKDTRGVHRVVKGKKR